MKQQITNESLKELRGTVTLIHGLFDPSFYDVLQERHPQQVFVLEGRPSLESGKIAVKELNKRNIQPVVIADNMAGFLFYKKLAKEVWLAAVDQDKRGILCFIGGSILGLLAKQHELPVFCYPSSKKMKKNDPIMGTEKELTNFEGVGVAPKGTKAYVPLLEWLPGRNFIQDESRQKTI